MFWRKMRLRRLLFRVYLFGLLLFVGVGAAQFTVGHLVLRPSLRGASRHHVAWIVDKALPVGASAAELHSGLADLQRELGLQVSLYDLQGQLIDSSASPPLPPLTSDELALLRAGRPLPSHPRLLTRVGRFERGQLSGYAIASPHRPEPPPWRVLMPMLLILLVVAVASVPFARSLTQPLEQLAETAQRFGQGDLRAREKSDRQDEVGDLARSFNEMAAHIEQLVCTEKELLANVSHELRTPLARIRVALDLAASDGAKLNYLPEIAEDLGELERMIDDILTTTRLDLAQQRMGRSTTPLRFEPTDLRQVLARAISRFSDHHPDRELLVEVPEQLPTLPADPVMLRRVLDNLLDNADKYSNSDRPIALRAAVLPTPADAKRVQIVLADHGIGIDHSDLQHVFTPFFRSDRSRARQTGGVGLGLPLALRIVRAHGGTIDLASEVGTGTTVTVTLPLSSNA